MTPRPPHSTLFPYTTLFRSYVRLEQRCAPSASGRLYRGPEACQPLGHHRPIGRGSPGAKAAPIAARAALELLAEVADRKSTRLNSSHPSISYAVFCLKKKNN